MSSSMGHEVGQEPETVMAPADASAADERASEPSDVFARVVDAAVDRILDAFERKLAYDASKQAQVDRLHEELQEHRAGMADRVARPIVRGMIRMHDNIGKLASALRHKSADEFSATQFFTLLEGLQEDVEVLLAQNGVVAYRELTMTFDPRRQRAVKTIVTHDAQLGGQIAELLRPGFEQGGEVLEKARVVVYQWQAPAPSDPQLQDEESES